MDPQQRMILEVTDRAFADAGVSIRCAASERTGAFVSTSSDDYLLQSADLCRRELSMLTPGPARLAPLRPAGWAMSSDLPGR